MDVSCNGSTAVGGQARPVPLTCVTLCSHTIEAPVDIGTTAQALFTCNIVKHSVATDTSKEEDVEVASVCLIQVSPFCPRFFIFMYISLLEIN